MVCVLKQRRVAEEREGGFEVRQSRKKFRYTWQPWDEGVGFGRTRVMVREVSAERGVAPSVARESCDFACQSRDSTVAGFSRSLSLHPLLLVQ